MAKIDLQTLAALTALNAPRREERQSQQAMALRMYQLQQQQEEAAADRTARANDIQQSITGRLGETILGDPSVPWEVKQRFIERNPTYAGIGEEIDKAAVAKAVETLAKPTVSPIYEANKNNLPKLQAAIAALYANPAAAGGTRALNALPWNELNANLPTSITPKVTPTDDNQSRAQKFSDSFNRPRAERLKPLTDVLDWLHENTLFPAN